MFASEKWYNIELAWYEWEGFREALKKDGEEWGTPWIYEASECGVDADGERLVHVEIKCAPADLPYLNEFLMVLAWYHSFRVSRGFPVKKPYSMNFCSTKKFFRRSKNYDAGEKHDFRSERPHCYKSI